MANYYTNLYNDLIENAKNTCDFLDGTYLDSFENMTFECNSNSSYVINGMKFIRIDQYRKLSSDKDTISKIKSILKGSLEGYHNAGCAVGYFIVSYNNTINIFYASDANSSIGFDVALEKSIPDLRTKNQFVGRTILNKCSQYGGVITGAIDIEESVLDIIINKISNRNCVLGIIAKPFERAESKAYLQALRSLSEMCKNINSYDQTFGSGTKRTVTETFPDVTHLNAIVDNIEKRFSESANEMWKTCLWFAGETREDADVLAQTVISAFSSSSNKILQKFRRFMSTSNPFNEGMLFIPSGVVRIPSFSIDNSLILSSFISLMNSNELSSYMQVPLHSYNGISVISTEHKKNDVYEYDTTSDARGDIRIGQIAETMLPYNISLHELVNHLLVVGGTGSGKTNTIMNLLLSVNENSVPFCIIESAKKEYWYLAEKVNNLKIYSSGSDAIDLKMNPLAPEEGVYIGNHIDDLIYAFCGAFDMETPTKAALQNLLVYTYEHFGWNSGDIAFNGTKKYPTIKDVLDLLPQFCDNELVYGGEVGSNIQGAISNRLNTLIKGPVGNIVNCEKGISASDLCSRNTLIELDDLSISVRPFITNVLVVKMNQYLRQKDADGRLKNLIIIEEAHNVFSEVSHNGTKTSKDLASEYFSNLLSEIRAYGTAMVIVDQSPTQINSNAISNTALKVVHALNSEEDAKEITYALNLTDYQKNQLTNLKTGECVIGRRGDRNVCKVKIDKVPNIQTDNLSCLFCNLSSLCKNDNRSFTINNNDINLFATRLFNVRFDSIRLNQEIEGITRECGVPHEKSRCMLGYILSQAEIDCSDREKRRIIHLYN